MSKDEVAATRMSDAEMADRVEALDKAVEDRFGGMRAEFTTGGSMSVHEALSEFVGRLRKPDESGARERLSKLTVGKFYLAAQAGNLAIDAVLADIRELL
jgi:hypothetical protein